MGAAQHRPAEHPHGFDGRFGRADLVDDGERLPAQRDDALLDLGADAKAAQATLEVVGMRAGEARVRRAQEPEEIAAAARLPQEAERGEQRVAERRLPQPDAALDRVGHARCGEHGLERRPQPVDRRADERDGLRRGAVAQEAEHLGRDELERAARARRFQEANGAFERRRIDARTVREDRPLEMRERRVRDLRVGGRQFLHLPVGEIGEIGRGLGQRRERRTAGLVGKGGVDLGAARECLQ